TTCPTVRRWQLRSASPSEPAAEPATDRPPGPGGRFFVRAPVLPPLPQTPAGERRNKHEQRRHCAESGDQRCLPTREGESHDERPDRSPHDPVQKRATS